VRLRPSTQPREMILKLSFGISAAVWLAAAAGAQTTDEYQVKAAFLI